jgi:hypothetical protein
VELGVPLKHISCLYNSGMNFQSPNLPFQNQLRYPFCAGVETQVSTGAYRPYSKTLYWTCRSATTFAIFAVFAFSRFRALRVFAHFAFSRTSRFRALRVFAHFAFSLTSRTSHFSHSRIYRVCRAFRISRNSRFRFLTFSRISRIIHISRSHIIRNSRTRVSRAFHIFAHFA